jgi:Peptidase family S41
MKHPLVAFALALALMGVDSEALAVDSGPPALLQPTQLRQDLNFIHEALIKNHPDIHVSANATELRSALDRIEGELALPMTRDQAWRHFATLNPVFADAHVTVISPDPQAQTRAILRSGRGLFPFEVNVDPTGRVYVLAELGGAPSSYKAASIEKVNGIPIQELTRALLGRTNGDTAAFRAVNLSTRWWWFYWKVFGTPETYEIELKSPSGTSVARLPASSKPPSWLTETDARSFDDAFRFWKLTDDVSVLTVNTFDWADKKRFYEFTQRAFSSLKDEKTKTLVIDIRKNGGGDDDMWKEGILSYIATKPYRHGSSFLQRVIEGRQRDGQKVGDLVEGQIQSWVQPRSDERLVFKGNVFVVVGGATYSSAVLFANVVQDFGFGKLVGVGGYARTRQSGGTQSYTLPNSKLRIIVPRFILDSHQVRAFQCF